MIGAESLAIGVSLFMKDSFTAQATRAGAAMKGLTADADKLARTQAVAARNTAATGAAIGVGIIGGMGKAYKSAADMNYLVKYVGLLSDKSGKHFDNIKKKAAEVSQATMFDPLDIADAMRYMAGAGIEYQGIMNSISAATELAQATMGDVGGKGGTADWMTSLIKGWDMEQTEANFQHMSDVLGVSINKSKTTLGEFGEAMVYSMNTSNRLKMGFEETSAALMIMSNMGLRGSMGGVAMDNMLKYASRGAGSKEGSKQANALNALGLSQQDLKNAEGGLIPIGEILSKIQQGTAKMKGGTSGVDAQNAIYDIFGARGQRALGVGNHIDDYYKILGELKASAGYTKNMSNEMMDSEKGGLDMMMDNLIVLTQSLGNAFAPIFTPMVKFITALAHAITLFTDSGVGKFIAGMVGAFIMVKTAAFAYQAITLTIALMQTKLGTTAITMGAQTVSSLTSQTVAANSLAAAYTNVAMASGAAGFGTMTGFGKMKANGTPDMRTAQNRFAMHAAGPVGAANAIGLASLTGNATRGGRWANRLGKIGGFMGKASIPAMIGGIALGALSDSAGGNKTKAGVGIGVAGDTLSGASMGAMVGSVIPGIGTAIGGIIGGIGGLTYGLYSRMKELNELVDTKKAESDGVFTADHAKIRREFDKYQNLKPGQRAWVENPFNMSGERFGDNQGNPLTREWSNKVSTNITINMDGKAVMNKTYDEQLVKDLINLNYQ